jgi:hypothetical protein
MSRNLLAKTLRVRQMPHSGEILSVDSGLTPHLCRKKAAELGMVSHPANPVKGTAGFFQNPEGLATPDVVISHSGSVTSYMGLLNAFANAWHEWACQASLAQRGDFCGIAFLVSAQ